MIGWLLAAFGREPTASSEVDARTLNASTEQKNVAPLLDDARFAGAVIEEPVVQQEGHL